MAQQRLGEALAARRSRQRAIEQCFVQVLVWVLRSAFDYQSAGDLTLRMPRRLERHPLELRNGAQWWARHLATRRQPHPQDLS